MPELPEVECTRQSLKPRLLGRKVVGLIRGRHDVVAGEADQASLLVLKTIHHIGRLGKELAFFSAPVDADMDFAAKNDPAPRADLPDQHRGGQHACFVVHLGMTGRLQHRKPDESAPYSSDDPHLHLRWQLDDASELVFRDPRRFGGVWTYASSRQLWQQRWSHRGPDALDATPAALHHRLERTRRPLKAALLDQSVIAGLGNIYVDELLFATGLHPLTPACTIDRRAAAALTRRMRTLLQKAIEGGGSTLRDYADGQGRSGSYQAAHRVYGRSGLPCRRCGVPLTLLIVAGRSTVCCEACQPQEA